ncbi:DeoR family transcriptional regulator [Nitrospira sp.]|nr:DeoR family transcriptional regulator [Nitrospira sp.]
MTDRSAQAVQITEERLTLEGLLCVPSGAPGLVIFAHGSGSGRLSPRNNFVARHLQQSRLGTLLLDLLTEQEADDKRKVFNIDLLADRLLLAKGWSETDPRTRYLTLGYFGASTGAGAALQAAAREPSKIKAVVSRGGRPDLAEPYLPSVIAPTLLIVGSHDGPVIEMNQSAYSLLTCDKKLVIVPGATHLFEEPGTLDQVAEHASRWFERHLQSPDVQS